MNGRQRIASLEATALAATWAGFMFMMGIAGVFVAGSILDVTQMASAWGWAFSFNGVLAVLGVAALIWLKRLPEAVRMAGRKG